MLGQIPNRWSKLGESSEEHRSKDIQEAWAIELVRRPGLFFARMVKMPENNPLPFGAAGLEPVCAGV